MVTLSVQFGEFWQRYQSVTTTVKVQNISIPQVSACLFSVRLPPAPQPFTAAARDPFCPRGVCKWNCPSSTGLWTLHLVWQFQGHCVVWYVGGVCPLAYVMGVFGHLAVLAFVTFHCVFVPQLVHPFTCGRAFGLYSVFQSYELSC